MHSFNSVVAAHLKDVPRPVPRPSSHAAAPPPVHRSGAAGGAPIEPPYPHPRVKAPPKTNGSTSRVSQNGRGAKADAAGNGVIPLAQFLQQQRVMYDHERQAHAKEHRLQCERARLAPQIQTQKDFHMLHPKQQMRRRKREARDQVARGEVRRLVECPSEDGDMSSVVGRGSVASISTKTHHAARMVQSFQSKLRHHRNVVDLAAAAPPPPPATATMPMVIPPPPLTTSTSATPASVSMSAPPSTSCPTSRSASPTSLPSPPSSSVPTRRGSPANPSSTVLPSPPSRPSSRTSLPSPFVIVPPPSDVSDARTVPVATEDAAAPPPHPSPSTSVVPRVPSTAALVALTLSQTSSRSAPSFLVVPSPTGARTPMLSQTSTPTLSVPMSTSTSRVGRSVHLPTPTLRPTLLPPHPSASSSSSHGAGTRSTHSSASSRAVAALGTTQPFLHLHHNPPTASPRAPLPREVSVPSNRKGTPVPVVDLTDCDADAEVRAQPAAAAARSAANVPTRSARSRVRRSSATVAYRLPASSRTPSHATSTPSPRARPSPLVQLSAAAVSALASPPPPPSMPAADTKCTTQRRGDRVTGPSLPVGLKPIGAVASVRETVGVHSRSATVPPPATRSAPASPVPANTQVATTPSSTHAAHQKALPLQTSPDLQRSAFSSSKANPTSASSASATLSFQRSASSTSTLPPSGPASLSRNDKNRSRSTSDASVVEIPPPTPTATVIASTRISSNSPSSKPPAVSPPPSVAATAVSPSCSAARLSSSSSSSSSLTGISSRSPSTAKVLPSSARVNSSSFHGSARTTSTSSRISGDTVPSKISPHHIGARVRSPRGKSALSSHSVPSPRLASPRGEAARTPNMSSINPLSRGVHSSHSEVNSSLSQTSSTSSDALYPPLVPSKPLTINTNPIAPSSSTGGARKRKKSQTPRKPTTAKASKKSAKSSPRKANAKPKKPRKSSLSKASRSPTEEKSPFLTKAHFPSPPGPQQYIIVPPSLQSIMGPFVKPPPVSPPARTLTPEVVAACAQPPSPITAVDDSPHVDGGGTSSESTSPVQALLVEKSELVKRREQLMEEEKQLQGYLDQLQSSGQSDVVTVARPPSTGSSSPGASTASSEPVGADQHPCAPTPTPTQQQFVAYVPVPYVPAVATHAPGEAATDFQQRSTTLHALALAALSSSPPPLASAAESPRRGSIDGDAKAPPQLHENPRTMVAEFSRIDIEKGVEATPAHVSRTAPNSSASDNVHSTESSPDSDSTAAPSPSSRSVRATETSADMVSSKRKKPSQKKSAKPKKSSAKPKTPSTRPPSAKKSAPGVGKKPSTKPSGAMKSAPGAGKKPSTKLPGAKKSAPGAGKSAPGIGKSARGAARGRGGQRGRGRGRGGRKIAGGKPRKAQDPPKKQSRSSSPSPSRSRSRSSSSSPSQSRSRSSSPPIEARVTRGGAQRQRRVSIVEPTAAEDSGSSAKEGRSGRVGLRGRYRGRDSTDMIDIEMYDLENFEYYSWDSTWGVEDQESDSKSKEDGEEGQSDEDGGASKGDGEEGQNDEDGGASKETGEDEVSSEAAADGAEIVRTASSTSDAIAEKQARPPSSESTQEKHSSEVSVSSKKSRKPSKKSRPVVKAKASGPQPKSKRAGNKVENGAEGKRARTLSVAKKPQRAPKKSVKAPKKSREPSKVSRATDKGKDQGTKVSEDVNDGVGDVKVVSAKNKQSQAASKASERKRGRANRTPLPAARSDGDDSDSAEDSARGDFDVSSSLSPSRSRSPYAKSTPIFARTRSRTNPSDHRVNIFALDLALSDDELPLSSNARYSASRNRSTSSQRVDKSPRSSSREKGGKLPPTSSELDSETLVAVVTPRPRSSLTVAAVGFASSPSPSAAAHAAGDRPSRSAVRSSAGQSSVSDRRLSAAARYREVNRPLSDSSVRNLISATHSSKSSARPHKASHAVSRSTSSSSLGARAPSPSHNTPGNTAHTRKQPRPRQPPPSSASSSSTTTTNSHQHQQRSSSPFDSSARLARRDPRAFYSMQSKMREMQEEQKKSAEGRLPAQDRKLPVFDHFYAHGSFPNRFDGGGGGGAGGKRRKLSHEDSPSSSRHPSSSSNIAPPTSSGVHEEDEHERASGATPPTARAWYERPPFLADAWTTYIINLQNNAASTQPSLTPLPELYANALPRFELQREAFERMRAEGKATRKAVEKREKAAARALKKAAARARKKAAAGAAPPKRRQRKRAHSAAADLTGGIPSKPNSLPASSSRGVNHTEHVRDVGVNSGGSTSSSTSNSSSRIQKKPRLSISRSSARSVSRSRESKRDSEELYELMMMDREKERVSSRTRSHQPGGVTRKRKRIFTGTKLVPSQLDRTSRERSASSVRVPPPVVDLPLLEHADAEAEAEAEAEVLHLSDGHEEGDRSQSESVSRSSSRKRSVSSASDAEARQDPISAIEPAPTSASAAVAVEPSKASRPKRKRTVRVSVRLWERSEVEEEAARARERDLQQLKKKRKLTAAERAVAEARQSASPSAYPFPWASPTPTAASASQPHSASDDPSSVDGCPSSQTQSGTLPWANASLSASSKCTQSRSATQLSHIASPSSSSDAADGGSSTKPVVSLSAAAASASLPAHLQLWLKPVLIGDALVDAKEDRPSAGTEGSEDTSPAAQLKAPRPTHPMVGLKCPRSWSVAPKKPRLPTPAVSAGPRWKPKRASSKKHARAAKPARSRKKPIKICERVPSPPPPPVTAPLSSNGAPTTPLQEPPAMISFSSQTDKRSRSGDSEPRASESAATGAASAAKGKPSAAAKTTRKGSKPKRAPPKKKKKPRRKPMDQFEYITENVYRYPLRKPKRPNESDDCQCTPGSPCYPHNCLNGVCWYECDPEVCPAKENCQNQRIQKRRWLTHPKIKLVETPGKGCGIRATELIHEGELVIEYVGEMITKGEWIRRYEASRKRILKKREKRRKAKQLAQQRAAKNKPAAGDESGEDEHSSKDVSKTQKSSSDAAESKNGEPNVKANGGEPKKANSDAKEEVDAKDDADSDSEDDADEDAHAYFYWLGSQENKAIDAGPRGNLARFINHSCEPNCVTQKWQVLGESRVGIFAIRDILEGQEVTFNYSLEAETFFQKKCRCGAPSCSGVLGRAVNTGQ